VERLVLETTTSDLNYIVFVLEFQLAFYCCDTNFERPHQKWGFKLEGPCIDGHHDDFWNILCIINKIMLFLSITAGLH
jgi:hypothetical protein